MLAKEFNKITIGFVIQEFVTLGGKSICVKQEFVAGDQVDYEDRYGEPIEPSIATEQYESLDMVQPHNVTRSDKGLLYTCPDCKNHRLECVENGDYTSEVLNLDKDGDFDFGGVQADGDTERFQCLDCGFALTNKYPGFSPNFITEHEEVVTWIRDNCEQPE